MSNSDLMVVVFKIWEEKEIWVPKNIWVLRKIWEEKEQIWVEKTIMPFTIIPWIRACFQQHFVTSKNYSIGGSWDRDDI